MTDSHANGSPENQPPSFSKTDVRLEFVYDAMAEASEQGATIDVSALIRQAPELESEIRSLVDNFMAANGHLPDLELETSDGRFDDTKHVTAATRLTGLTEHDAGGFGRLMKARDDDLGRDVAVKVLPRERNLDVESRERFLREAEVTGQLLHPGVVPIYCRGETLDKRPFYVMPFLEDGSLSQAIEQFHQEVGPTYDATDRVFRDLLNRFASACKTVAYAHNRGVMHRDIKPQNIMLGRFGETLVIDWGLAETTTRDDHHRQSGEQSVQLRGSLSTSRGGYTPQYASPEQMQDGSDITSASDIYSLGATLYKLLTGSAPIRKSTHGEIRTAAIKGDYDPPRTRHASAPKPLDAICRKAMSLDPTNRYATPLKMAEDIEAFLADQPVTALPDTRVERMLRSMRQRLTSVIGSIAALILLAVVLAISAISQRAMKSAVAESAKERLTLAANLAAKVGGAEIDRRWRMLEEDALAPQLVDNLTTMLAANLDNEDDARAYETAQAAMQAWLTEAFVKRTQIDGVAIGSLTINDAHGVQVARVPRAPETLGKNYAFRAYFHGQPSDLPPGTSAAPTPRPVVSPVYISQATHEPRLTLMVAVRDESETVIGRYGMSVAVGQLGLFSELGENEVPMLVESRSYDVGEVAAVGLIADHPQLVTGDVTTERMPHVDGNGLADLRGPRWLSEFVDPLDNYTGDAVAAPVIIPGRPRDQADSGWIVILHPAAD